MVGNLPLPARHYWLGTKIAIVADLPKNSEASGEGDAVKRCLPISAIWQTDIA